jgi:hypothetical protein
MKKVLVRLRELTKELNKNDVIEDGSCLLAVMNMSTANCDNINMDRLIGFWDAFVEDMRSLGINCYIRSPRMNGENGNEQQK